MKLASWKIIFCIFLISLSELLPAKTTQIVFWHAFEGFLNDKFIEIVNDFNYQSKGYEIKLVYKGNYKDTYEKGIEAFKEGTPPHILQVSEVATQTMMLSNEVFVPVDALLKNYFRKFDSAIYIDAVREFYSMKGNMYSLPWNPFTGILFYNKDLFEKIGLDPIK